MIVYLHGFRSSPKSTKARVLRDALAARGRLREFDAPELPIAPREAMGMLLERWDRVDPAHLAFVGSSLGGFYATWLAERLGCRAVLLNPGVFAYRDLARHVGTHTSWHDPAYEFELTQHHIEQLASLDVPAITRPERYFLIAAKGDEVIDWQEMVAKYPGARQRVLDGSDHGLTGFETLVDEVIEFCPSEAA